MEISHPKKLILTVMATECLNRCKHCWAQGHPPLRVMELDTIKWIIREFEKSITQIKGLSELRFMLMNDPWCHPNCLELYQYTKTNSNGLLESAILTNGHLLARRNRYKNILEEAVKLGIKKSRLTLHGLEKEHNWFVGRKRGFQDLIEAAICIDKAKIDVSWNIYVHKTNIAQFREMVDLVSSVTPKTFVNITIPSSQPNMRLTEYEPLRLAREDLGCIDLSIGENGSELSFVYEDELTNGVLNRTYDLTHMEADLKKHWHRGAFIPITCNRDFNIYEGTPGNHEYYYGNLQTDGITSVMESITSYRPKQLPFVYELAKMYGDKDCTKIHPSDISVLRKWLGRYFEDIKRNAIPENIDSEFYALA